MRAISGYVAQEDVLPGSLTVYEHLLFHAQLRLCGDAHCATDAAALSVRVLEVLGQLGLGLVAGVVQLLEHYRYYKVIFSCNLTWCVRVCC
jgi:ABC-type multidrug transport system ATPase subunit